MLVQLPPRLQFDYASVRRFLSLLRDEHDGDVVWEPRHSSWFSETADDLLREFKVARVATDPACVPSAGNPGGFSRLTYFRLHGPPRTYYSDYADEFLGSLARRLEILAGNTEAWCVFDNTAVGYATRNALGLKAKLDRLARG